MACKAKNLKAVQTLLELQADPNIANNVCLLFPPLIEWKRYIVLILLLQVEETPLLLAVERQEIEMVEALLKAGANPNKVNHSH